MSGSRPPSPVHPRDHSIPGRDMAAETLRHQTLPMSNFLGQPERHNSIGYLPPIIGHERSSISFSSPFNTLPPLRSRANPATNTQNHVQRAVPISKLLSDDTHEYSPRPRQESFPGPRSPDLPSPLSSSEFQRGTFNVSRPLPMATYRPAPPIFQVPQYHPQPKGTQVHAQYQLQSPPVSSNSPSSVSLDSGTSPRESNSAVSEGFNRLPSFSTPSPNLRYELGVRQQPVAARACGFGERDRRVVDPPPILELKVIDAETGKVDSERTPYVYTTLHCTLINAVTHRDESQIEPAHPGMPATQRLMGTAVASPFSGTDENGRRGTFFVFPDLSCRNPGRYRFQFRLLIVDPLNLSVGTTSRIQSSIISDPFEVYTAKEFPGMRASSGLLKALRKQGLNVAVKKGREATKKATRRNQGDEDSSACEGDNMADEDDQDSDDAHSPEPAMVRDRRKRKRRD